MDSNVDYRFFHVEKIIGVHIGEGNEILYHVQWAPTWEPLANLAGCENLIRDFWLKKSCQVLGVGVSPKQEEAVNLPKASSNNDNILGKISLPPMSVDLTSEESHVTNCHVTNSPVANSPASKSTPTDNSSSNDILSPMPSNFVSIKTGTAFKSTSKRRRTEKKPCSITTYKPPVNEHTSKTTQNSSIDKESLDISFEVLDESENNKTNNEKQIQIDNSLEKSKTKKSDSNSVVSSDSTQTPTETVERNDTQTADSCTEKENLSKESEASDSIFPIILNTIKNIEDGLNVMDNQAHQIETNQSGEPDKDIQKTAEALMELSSSRRPSTSNIDVSPPAVDGQNDQLGQEIVGTSDENRDNIIVTNSGEHQLLNRKGPDNSIPFNQDDDSNHVTSTTTSTFNASVSRKNLKKLRRKRKAKSKAFHCIGCNLYYQTETSLRRHCKVHHKKLLHLHEIDFKCYICKLQFIRMCNLVDHAKQHLRDGEYDDPPYGCGLCDESFDTTENLFSHAMSHEFDVYENIFSRKNSPAKSFSKSNILTCKFCALKFDDQKELRKHVMKHLKSKIGYKGLSPEKVKLARKNLVAGKTKITSNKNILSKKPIKDTLLSKTKTNSKTLLIKKQDKIQKKLKPAGNPSSTTSVKVTDTNNRKDTNLNKDTTDTTADTTHNTAYTTDKTADTTVNTNLKKDAVPPVRKVGRPRKRKNILQNGTEKKHKWYANKNKWECKACSLRFLNYYQLSKHKKLHNLKIKKQTGTFFQCPLCPHEKPKRGAQIFNLHCMRVHADVESFPAVKGMLKCPSCVMFFQNRRGLMMHMCKRHDMKSPEANDIISLCVEGANDEGVNDENKKLSKTSTPKSLLNKKKSNEISKASNSKEVSRNSIPTDENATPESSTRLRCKYCSSDFSNSIFLSRHERSAHRDESNTNSPPTEFNPDMYFQYICFICEKSYPTKASLLCHAKRLHYSFYDDFLDKFPPKLLRKRKLTDNLDSNAVDKALLSSQSSTPVAVNSTPSSNPAPVNNTSISTSSAINVTQSSSSATRNDTPSCDVVEKVASFDANTSNTDNASEAHSITERQNVTRSSKVPNASAPPLDFRDTNKDVKDLPNGILPSKDLSTIGTPKVGGGFSPRKGSNANATRTCQCPICFRRFSFPMHLARHAPFCVGQGKSES